MAKKPVIRDHFVEVDESVCDMCCCHRCPKKKECNDSGECLNVNIPSSLHIGVNWSSIGPVSPADAVVFARLILRRVAEAKRLIKKRRAKGNRVTPYCRFFE